MCMLRAVTRHRTPYAMSALLFLFIDIKTCDSKQGCKYQYYDCIGNGRTHHMISVKICTGAVPDKILYHQGERGCIRGTAPCVFQLSLYSRAIFL